MVVRKGALGTNSIPTKSHSLEKKPPLMYIVLRQVGSEHSTSFQVDSVGPSVQNVHTVIVVQPSKRRPQGQTFQNSKGFTHDLPINLMMDKKIPHCHFLFSDSFVSPSLNFWKSPWQHNPRLLNASGLSSLLHSPQKKMNYNHYAAEAQGPSKALIAGVACTTTVVVAAATFVLTANTDASSMYTAPAVRTAPSAVVAPVTRRANLNAASVEEVVAPVYTAPQVASSGNQTLLVASFSSMALAVAAAMAAAFGYRSDAIAMASKSGAKIAPKVYF